MVCFLAIRVMVEGAMVRHKVLGSEVFLDTADIAI
jgi:hypothetical protein